MKWIYDRPASEVHEHAIKYRADIPIRISDLRLSEDQIVPSFTVLLYTINFGEATDSKTEGMVYRPDGWTIGNQLYIVPPYEDNDTLKKRWLSTVAPLPTAEPGYKERMAFSDTHEKVDQDIIGPGGDTADMDAAVAEMEQERIKEQKDTSFGMTTFACGSSVYEDPRGFIADEYRPSLTCTLCQPDPLRTADAPFSGRKFHSLTSHVTYTHDACVYPSSRGYTYQQLVGGRQVCAARCWMNSALVEQVKEQQGQKPRSWSERKLTRMQGQSDTNGDLAPLQLVNQSKHTDHYHAPTATPVIDKSCQEMPLPLSSRAKQLKSSFLGPAQNPSKNQRFSSVLRRRNSEFQSHKKGLRASTRATVSKARNSWALPKNQQKPSLLKSGVFGFAKGQKELKSCFFQVFLSQNS